MPNWLMKYVTVTLVVVFFFFFNENKRALERLTLHQARHHRHKGSFVRVAVLPGDEKVASSQLQPPCVFTGSSSTLALRRAYLTHNITPAATEKLGGILTPQHRALIRLLWGS